MGAVSSIEWTEASWTPIRARNRVTGKVGWHCEHATPGCEHCYSESINIRLGTGLPFKPGHRGDIDIFLDEKMLLAPLHWKRPRMIFVCSMTDLFADFVKDEWIDRVFAVMALAPQHTFQILTKRSARMRGYLSMARAHPVGLAALEQTINCMAANPKSEVGAGCLLHGDIAHLKVWPLPNVWLGISAEDQPRADERIPDLLKTPAAVRFVSAEPLLGPIDFTVHDPLGVHGLDWIIVGSESGARARPMDIEWARAIRSACYSVSTYFFMKQMSGPGGRAIKDVAQFPQDLRVREFPRSAA